MAAPSHDSRPPRTWSPRRRARFVRTLLVVALALALVLGVWQAVHRSAGLPRSASSSAVSAPVATPSAASSPAPVSSAPSSSTATTLVDDDQGGTKGVYGDVSPDVPQQARGTFTVLPGRSAPATVPGREVRYSIEVEDGLGLDAEHFAETVSTTLLDPRGWQTQDHMRWVDVSPQQVAAGEHVDIRVTLASPRTVDRRCAPLNTNGVVSCFNGGRAMLNAQRWVTGAYTYGTDLARYRTYQINHEVGHGLGHGHVPCPKQGGRAPVMLQQTKTLQGCTSWPYPTGA